MPLPKKKSRRQSLKPDAPRITSALKRALRRPPVARPRPHLAAEARNQKVARVIANATFVTHFYVIISFIVVTIIIIFVGRVVQR